MAGNTDRQLSKGVMVAVLGLLLIGALAYWFGKSRPVQPAAVVPAAVVPATTSATPPGDSVPADDDFEPVAEPVDGQEQLPADDAAAGTAPAAAEPVTQTASPAQPADGGDAVPLSPAVVHAIQAIRQPAEGEGQVTVHPDGSKELKLGNRYRSVPVATVGKDGKVHVDYHGEAHVPDAAGTAH